MRREYLHWHSPSLGRRMELLWFGHWGRPLLLFPTSHGRFWEHEDFGLVRALEPRVEAGDVQLCCLDSVDRESWYNPYAHPADRVRRHEAYDRYLRDEVFPFAAHRAERGDLALFGPSFGAYHAVNLACRYPERVRKAIAFSGLFDIHRFLDGYWDDLCYFHCPTAYVPNLDESWVGRLRGVEFVVATGEYDHLAYATREFAGLLGRKGIPVRAEIWQGSFGHDWPFWAEHIGRFLP
jgi:esterase/lipase superfamily enzyme